VEKDAEPNTVTTGDSYEEVFYPTEVQNHTVLNLRPGRTPKHMASSKDRLADKTNMLTGP